jgi:hypothetical protein
MNQLQETSHIIRSLVGESGTLYLDDPVKYKFSPHFPPYFIQAVETNDRGEVYISDDPTDSENWHKLNPQHIQDGCLLASLYQRLMVIKQQLKTA